MENFVTGVVEANEATGWYPTEQNVFERTLTLRFSNGRRMHIFDPDLISTDLSVGETCEVLVEAMIFKRHHLRFFNHPPSVIDSAAWYGTIIEPRWTPPEIIYQKMIQNDYIRQIRLWKTFQGVLVSTPMGRMVVNDWDLAQAIRENIIYAGGFVQWTDCRFDLLAIL